MNRSARTLSKIAFLVGSVLVACGTRSGLLTDTEPGSVDASVEVDAVADVGRDAPIDALPDVRDAFDAADAQDTFDAKETAIEFDALPPIEAGTADVDRRDCTDPSQTLVYLLGTQNELVSYDPASGAFRTVGTLACPSNGGSPNSMAVNRTGVAYVGFTTGELFRVSTRTGACAATPFVAGQNGFQQTFGMGFASDTGGPAEHLYVMQGSPLATIDTATFALRVIGAPSWPSTRSELTGTGDGRLFAYGSDPNNSGAFVAQLDKATGATIAVNRVQTPVDGSFAFAFWGGDFYLFNAPGATSTVTKYSPADNSETVVATAPMQVVGAGVSTCAPQ